MHAGDCDWFGVTHPVTGEYYRYRFLVFGSSQSPFIQQQWAIVIKGLVNEHGLRYCSPESPESDAASFICTAALLDDFHCCHSSALSFAQAQAQLRSVLRFLRDDLGLEIKSSKTEGPSKSLCYTGLLIHSEHQIVTITAQRAAELQADLSTFLQAFAEGSLVSRVELASLIGRCQFCAAVIPGAQSHLLQAYKARDNFANGQVASWPMRRQWRGVQVVVAKGLLQDLQAWVELLQELPQRPFFLSHHPGTSGFWKGLVSDTDPDIDCRLITSVGIPVFTTDASGPRGGAWYLSSRLSFRFNEIDCKRSSNWRELYTILHALERWGPQLAQGGPRVLVRTDNASAVAAVNRAYSTSADLNALAQRITAVAAGHGLVLAARHIPGISNKLADALSRWKPDSPAAHRSLRQDLYDGICLQVPSHDVDACSDPCGENSFCGSFWSIVQDGLEQIWEGRRVWCHPPVGIADLFLQHFKSAFARQPSSTSATFLLPAWPQNRLWRHLKGARLLRHWRKGSPILSAGVTMQGVPTAQYYDCPWDAVVVEFSAAACRLTDELKAMPILSGRAQDAMLLRELHSPPLPTMPGLGGADVDAPGGLPALQGAADSSAIAPSGLARPRPEPQ